MINENVNIGTMVINETVSNPDIKREVISDKNGSVKIRTNLQDCKEINRNIRKYPFAMVKKGWREQERSRELFSKKSLLGEAGHPGYIKDPKAYLLRQQRINFDNASHRILSMDMNDNGNISGIVKTTPNNVGRMMRDLILDDDPMTVAFSLRAIGKIVISNGVRLVVEPFMPITYDWVIYPSHRNAYQTEILGESSILGIQDENCTSSLLLEDRTDIINFRNNALDFIKEESCIFKTLNNYVDMSKYTTSLTEDSNLLLTTQDNMGNASMNINIEKNISNEINDYFSKLF